MKVRQGHAALGWSSLVACIGALVVGCQSPSQGTGASDPCAADSACVCAVPPCLDTDTSAGAGGVDGVGSPVSGQAGIRPSGGVGGGEAVAGAGGDAADLPVPDAPLAACDPVGAGNSVAVHVQVNNIVADVSDQPFGLNMNYLADDDNNRPAGARPLAEALKELGAKRLRYPGGEKSDSYFWSVPPYDKARPTLVRANVYPSNDPKLVDVENMTFRIDPLDFDEFMDVAQAAAAEPILVVCYDNLEKFAGTDITVDSMLTTAVEWVRYANVTHDYGIRYWEISNESWVEGGPDPQVYANDLVRFSRAMKDVDPSIKIGASGASWLEDSWQVILPMAGPDIDLLVTPNYSGNHWGSYQYYIDHDDLNLVYEMDHARDSLIHAPEADRTRLRVGATEVNSNDFAIPGWSKENNLGHALVTFDTFMQLLLHDLVEYANLWNTRWWPEVDAEGNQLPLYIWFALDDYNNILPSGRVLQILSMFVKDQMVEVSADSKGVVSYASYDPSNQSLSVFLVNKGYQAQTVSLDWTGLETATSAHRWDFSGTGSEDLEPTWGANCELPVAGAATTLELAPVSLSVIHIADFDSADFDTAAR